jgi:hypothetical protein
VRLSPAPDRRITRLLPGIAILNRDWSVRSLRTSRLSTMDLLLGRELAEIRHGSPDHLHPFRVPQQHVGLPGRLRQLAQRLVVGNRREHILNGHHAPVITSFQSRRLNRE